VKCIGATPNRSRNITSSSTRLSFSAVRSAPNRHGCSVSTPGNFIEATADTPYFQIGESKYGKPILDRVVTRSTSLAQGAKCALISMDSTIRSNLSVGLPLDLLSIQRDTWRVHSHVNITEDHTYFKMIRTRWSESLRHAFHEMPDPDWMRRS
jgi:putative proteasome-type protease